MVYNLLDHGHSVVAFNRSPEAVERVKIKGAIGASSITELIQSLSLSSSGLTRGSRNDRGFRVKPGMTRGKKIVWIMITAGKPVDEMITMLLPHLKRGDIVVDGGNSFFKDSIRRGRELEKKGIQFLDVGVSGGIEGARHGACMMVGGHAAAFKVLEPVISNMCVKGGYGYMGKPGAGHFVKMVHNGIEYGMMAAIAEGMQAVQKFSKVFGTDLSTVAGVYAHGSIVTGRLMSWLVSGMSRKEFTTISGVVPKGETEEEMEKLEKLVTMKMLTQARLLRVATRTKASYAGKLISVMRNEFGGHKYYEK